MFGSASDFIEARAAIAELEDHGRAAAADVGAEPESAAVRRSPAEDGAVPCSCTQTEREDEEW